MFKFSKFFFGFLVLFFSSEVFGQCPPSGGGSFTGTITTTCVVNGNLEQGNGDLTIGAGGNLTINGSFLIDNNRTFTVTGGGVFTTTGDFTSGKNADLQFLDGEINIGGNLDSQGNGTIDADGVVKVTGDFTTGGGDINIGGGLAVGGTATFNSNGASSTVNVEPGAVIQATTLVNDLADNNFTIEEGGTIYVPNGIPTSPTIVLEGTPKDNNCLNNCCGAQCTPEGSGGGDALTGTGNEVLPIQLSSFDLVKKETYVEIQWVSQTELNNDFYELERAVSGAEFSVIAKINGAGNSQSPIAYSYHDYINNDGLVYYRLKQTDYDGKFEYFDIKTIDASDLSASKIKIMPNSARSGSRVKIVGLPVSDGRVELQLFDLAGRNSFQIEIELELGQHSFVMPNIQSGIYILVGEAYGIQIRERVIAQ
ncbi:MAG: hypothetical protein RIA69_04485 [Cyclobacteriaceae bacterium]